MRPQRKHWTAQEKAAIVREHLIDKTPISDLCDKHGLHPTLLYRWQKEMFEHAAAAFGGDGQPSQHKLIERKVALLEEKLAHKDEVIAEIMQDHVALKKNLA